MKLLTIIPARSGSKGIKNKNIVNFLGKPLINYSINFAKKIRNNTIIISTDSNKIKNVAKKSIILQKYLRPNKISKDNTLLEETLEHVVKWSIDKKIIFDYILILQPTSPLRKLKDFNNIIKTLKIKKYNSLCSVVKMTTHPSECLVKKKNKWSFLINAKIGNRQKYKNNYFFIDGSFYFVKKNYFLKNKKILSNRNCFYPISIEHPLDIDCPLDLKIAEIIYKHKNQKS